MALVDKDERATPDRADVELEVRDHGDIQLACSTQLYDFRAHTGEPTHVLFGGWHTEYEIGFLAAVHTRGETNVRMYTEEREGRDIQTELRDRIEQAIERSQARETTNSREPEHDNQREPAQLEASQPPTIEPLERDPELQP